MVILERGNLQGSVYSLLAKEKMENWKEDVYDWEEFEEKPRRGRPAEIKVLKNGENGAQLVSEETPGSDHLSKRVHSSMTLNVKKVVLHGIGHAVADLGTLSSSTMTAMDPHNVQGEDHVPIATQPPPPVALATTQLRKATEFLEDSTRIGSHRSRYAKYRRYVNLYSSAIFANLVTLYTSLLISQWPRFKRLSDTFPAPQGVAPQMYAASVYISHWFLDLYVSNRDAVKKLWPLAFAQHFQQEVTPFATEYDRYLSLLNAAIRPTHVKGILEDVLYIPLISQTINWNDENPFNITNFNQNYDYFMGIIDLMKEFKNWNMSTVVTDTLGRSSWLFDWHDDICCVWFPAKGNYSAEDVTIAYIIGTACTPKMAPCDVDDWTFLDEKVQHPPPNASNLNRITDRRFYGSYEVRTAEFRVAEYPEISHKDATSKSKKRKTRTGSIVIGGPAQTSESSSSRAEPSLALIMAEETKIAMKQGYQYQIIDWLYYCRVILEIDPHTRSGALKSIIMS